MKLGILLAVATAATAHAAEPQDTSQVVKNEAYANATNNPATVQIREWFALGSGCRAKFDTGGDVSMEMVEVSPQNPNIWRVRFHLPKFALEADKPVNKGRPTFARECSLRFSLFFPADRRISNIDAAAAVEISKDKEAGAEVATQVLAGPTVLSKQLTEFAKGNALKPTTITHKHNIGKTTKEKLPEQPCGTPRILGFDLHLLTNRAAEKVPVKATLAGDKTVELNITFESCSATTPSPLK